MADVSDIHKQFMSVLGDCRSLFTHCLTPVGQHTNAGVESAFLEAFKAWEVFLEELTVAYLTSERTIAGKLVPAVISDTKICRRVVNGGRPYISWADPNQVKKRFILYFMPSTLAGTLNSGIPEIREMVTCRHAIAHSSGPASDNLTNLWTRKAGVSKSPLRSADVLLLNYPPNPPFTWFDRYLQVVEVLSQELVEIRTTDGA